jgi:hypothetical protein
MSLMPGATGTQNMMNVGKSSFTVQANGYVGIDTGTATAPLTVGSSASSNTYVVCISSQNGSCMAGVTGGGQLQGSNFAYSNGVDVSSSATTPSLTASVTGTTLGPCIASSTMTLTIPLGVSKIQYQYHGSWANSVLGDTIILGILVNGAFVDGETTAIGLVTVTQAVAADNSNMSFSELISGLTGGTTYNVCLTGAVNAGTGTLNSTTGVSKAQMYMLP